MEELTMVRGAVIPAFLGSGRSQATQNPFTPGSVQRLHRGGGGLSQAAGTGDLTEVAVEAVKGQPSPRAAGC
jgi:hypothetical protein